MSRLFSPVIIIFLLVTSCAKTTLLSTWRDDSYSGNINRVLIIGGSEKPGMRRIFEQEFANQLKSHGIYALPSNHIIPSDKMLDKEAVLSKIKDLNIDAVLVTRLVEKKTVGTHYADWYDPYTKSYGRTFVDNIVNLETNLYDTRTDRLIWSALSETMIMEEDSIYKKLKSFIKIMVNNLSKQKLI